MLVDELTSEAVRALESIGHLNLYPDDVAALLALRDSVSQCARSHGAYEHAMTSIVVGSGPAGQKAAVQAAKAGRRVALIEQLKQVGGACVHQGTIPSKALRERAVERRRIADRLRETGSAVGGAGQPTLHR